MRPGTPSLPSWYPKRPGKQDLDHSQRRCRVGLYVATSNRRSLLDDAFGTAGADLRLVGWPRSGGDDFRRCVHRRAERSTEGDGNRPHDGNSVWYERPLGFGRFGRAAATGFLRVGGQSHNEYSEETARIVDEEIKLLLTDAHQKVRSFLSSCRDALEELAQLLLEKEVVERPALQSILNGRRTKDRDATDTVRQGQSPSDGPIGKSA